MGDHNTPVTTGDHYNIRCPYPDCDKNNVYVTDGIAVKIGEAVCFLKPCFYCHRSILYEVSLIRAVVATTEEDGFLNAFPPTVEKRRIPFQV